MTQTTYKKPIRSFVKNRARALSQTAHLLLQEGLEHWQISRQDIINLAQQTHNPREPQHAFCSIYLEIGMGTGAHLLYQARRNPNTLYIGVDPFETGIVKTLRVIKQENLHNIRLYHGDVHDILQNPLSQQELAGNAPTDPQILPVFDGIYILFPDPWPKSRHHKRRLIQPAFLDIIHAHLKPHACLYFASDIPSYIDWTFAHLRKHSGFTWQAQRNWHIPYADWPQDKPLTSYQTKALIAGRLPQFFIFSRQDRTII